VTTATETQPAEDLALTPTEQAVLVEEILPFAETLGDPGLRARYVELHAAAEAGRVPAELTGLASALAELLLQTQRVRRRHGPEGERALTALYYRTPRGAALVQSAREVSAALTALRGQVLEDLTFTPAPGAQRLRITTVQGQLEIIIDRAGVRVERVDLGSATA
jgi:hypothetical protein